MSMQNVPVQWKYPSFHFVQCVTIGLKGSSFRIYKCQKSFRMTAIAMDLSMISNQICIMFSLFDK